MALNTTIYKLKITLSDINRNHYDALNLTVAQHPSETLERMMARVLAFCLNAQESLVFTKGLSAPQEPDLWSRALNDQISLWIEVGEPSVEKTKKATRLSPVVKIYAFNSKASVWWAQERARFNELKASIFQFQWKEVQTLSALAKRTMGLSVTITGETAYISAENGECEVSWAVLQGCRHD